MKRILIVTYIKRERKRGRETENIYKKTVEIQQQKLYVRICSE